MREVQSIYPRLAAICVIAITTSGVAQQQLAKKSPAKPATTAPRAAKLTQGQKFVIDTVKMAVALPESDQQDRLRVLASAAEVTLPIDKKMAKGFWTEGARIESELIRVGQTPSVSIMSTGQVDCTVAQSFVENLPDAAVARAEQSLIGAITTCPKQTLDPVSRKLDAALGRNIVAPRALMAAIQTQGEKSVWSQAHFAKMFDSLPDPKENAAEAENFAAMYAQMAPEVNKDIAASSGLRFLNWLSKLDDSPLRGLSIHITSDAMRQALGEEAYQKALQSDVVANSTVQNAGEIREIQREEPQGVSRLAAMSNQSTDQTERLSSLPAPDRAREAAANGFAAGHAGKKQQAGKYFDIAFSAADEVWDARTPEMNAAAVVQEVSEAAAEVDSVNALMRAQKLRDSSAQAIAMLAVARVVASNGVSR